MEGVINYTASIKDAYVMLNTFSDKKKALALFVVNDDNVLLGSLTDGDIRRFLVSGGVLQDEVYKAMHEKCIYVKYNQIKIVQDLRSCRDKGITLVPVINERKQIIDIYDLVKYKSHLPIDAVLMAGGKGERLRPLTEKIPKPLLKVGNKAIIDYNIDRLLIYDVKHISVTVNYLKEQLEEHFAEARHDIKVDTVREPKFLGTMGSIQFIEKFYNDTVLVMNSDLFTNIDYEGFFLHFKENNADMSIAAVPYTVSVPYGIFELEGRNVRGVLEKPTYNYYANGGIYLIKRELLNLIPKDEFFNATDFINILMEKGYKVIRFPLNGTWIDIGNPQEYQKANELAKHIR